jgi:hypothetical protein
VGRGNPSDWIHAWIASPDKSGEAMTEVFESIPGV